MNPPGKSSFLTGVCKLLSEGPFELLTYIQLFLDPVDILALRFTCKYLSGATRSRTVWMNAVRSVSIAQGVFLPSFSVEQMSLDDLEHAALSPCRFRIRVREADRITPFFTRLFTPQLHSVDLEPDSILTVNLVPGGRFLFTSNRKGELHLWDIGYNAGGDMKTSPVATLAGSKRWPNRRVDHIRPTLNSDSLYVFTSEQGDIPSGYRDDLMAFYEIYPTSEDPQFSRLGTLSIYNVYRSTSSKGYLVCYQNRDSVFTVWKYTAQGLGVRWLFCQDDDPGDFYGMFICDGNLITFHTNDFCLWTIPDLTPLIDGEATFIDSEHLEPKLRLAYLSVDGGWLKVALSSCSLPESAQKQFGVYHDKNTIMAHYEIKSIDALQELGLPNILPIHSGSVLSSQNPFCRDIGHST